MKEIWKLETWRTNEQVISRERGGLYLHFERSVDCELRSGCMEFARWIRKRYLFPVEVNLFFVGDDQVKALDGEMTDMTFWKPDFFSEDPYGRLAVGDYLKNVKELGKESAMESVLDSMAILLTFYYQWLNGINLTERGEVRQAHRVASTVLEQYKMYSKKTEEEGAMEARKIQSILQKEKRRHRVVSLYAMPSEESPLSSGYVMACDTDSILMQEVDPYGYEDGISLTRLDRIGHLETDGKYEKRLQKLFALNKQKSLNEEKVIHEALLENYLQEAFRDQRIVTIYSVESEGGDLISGYITELDETSITLQILTYYGEKDSVCYLDKERINYVRSQSHYEQSIGLLNEMAKVE